MSKRTRIIPYDRYQEPPAELQLRTVLTGRPRSSKVASPTSPWSRRRLRHTIGHTYGNLGNRQSGRVASAAAPSISARPTLAKSTPNTLQSMMYLAWAKYDPDYMTRVLETRRRVLGKDHRDTLRSMFALAMVTRAKGEQTRRQSLHCASH